MKYIKINLPVIVLLFFMCNNNSHAQSECDLYSKILDSLYNRTLSIKIHVNRPEKIDPLNASKEFSDTTTSIFKFPYFVVIDEELNPIFDLQGNEAISSMAKYRKLKNLHFTLSETENLSNCDFSSENFCFQKYKKGRDSIDFRKKIDCSIDGEKRNVEKKLIQFSKFLKSSDSNFLVTKLLVKEFYNPGLQQLWEVVLHKQKNKWSIERLEIISHGR